MASREAFYGCTLTVGERAVRQRAIRAWDPAEAAEAFAAGLREDAVRARGEIAVRDGAGKVVRRSSYPARGAS